MADIYSCSQRVALSFDFPFYGHNLRQIIVATGGESHFALFDIAAALIRSSWGNVQAYQAARSQINNGGIVLIYFI